MNKKIRDLREKKFPGRGGATVCAEQFGVGRQQWYDWESGKSNPGTRNQQKLAKFFGITVAELRGDDTIVGNEKSPPPVVSGEIEDARNELLLNSLRIQELLSRLCFHLADRKSAIDFQALEPLLNSVRSLQELLEAVQQSRKTRDRIA